ncbi:MAG: hypothetical protein VKK42_07105 [Lyngbya sp.]|nr:hypothetical protein [Lyngbya sp.]
MIIQQLWIRILIWLIIEILLNLLGLDELADYSEFIFNATRTRPPTHQS